MYKLNKAKRKKRKKRKRKRGFLACSYKPRIGKARDRETERKERKEGKKMGRDRETERKEGNKKGRETGLNNTHSTRVAICKIKRRSWICANKRAMAPDMQSNHIFYTSMISIQTLSTEDPKSNRTGVLTGSMMTTTSFWRERSMVVWIFLGQSSHHFNAETSYPSFPPLNLRLDNPPHPLRLLIQKMATSKRSKVPDFDGMVRITI
jgi:hypothetical protein